jgi:hypothetical protein
MTVWSLQKRPWFRLAWKRPEAQGHFLLQVLSVALQFRSGKAGVAPTDGRRGLAGEEKAVDILDLVVLTNFAHG